MERKEMKGAHEFCNVLRMNNFRIEAFGARFDPSDGNVVRGVQANNAEEINLGEVPEYRAADYKWNTQSPAAFAFAIEVDQPFLDNQELRPFLNSAFEYMNCDPTENDDVLMKDPDGSGRDYILICFQ